MPGHIVMTVSRIAERECRCTDVHSGFDTDVQSHFAELLKNFGLPFSTFAFHFSLFTFRLYFTFHF